MNLSQAIKKVERMAERLPVEMERAEARNLKTTKSRMVHFASGPMGRGKRRALLPIGRVSEQLVESFATEGPEAQGDSLHSEAWNFSAHAPYLDDGTRNKDGSQRIAPRPLAEAVVRDVEPQITARREAAIDRAFR